MNYLSLCAVLQNEAAYLDEWVRYHAMLGIEHFYLYDNDSTDATVMLIKKLSLEFPISFKPIHGCPSQFRAYEDCLANVKPLTRWITFIDCDEFIVPRIKLHTWLPKFESYPGVAMHWYLFGSNGHDIYNPTPVVERFTKRQVDVNPHIKCFVDPTRTNKCHTAHRFLHNSDIVDEKFKPIKNNSPLAEEGSCDDIQLNHYVTKSYEECMQRRSRRRADTGELRDAEGFFAAHDRNEVEDFKALNIWKLHGYSTSSCKSKRS